MKTCLGGVCNFLVWVESAMMWLGLALVIPSAGLMAPGIRQVEWMWEVVMRSRQR